MSDVSTTGGGWRSHEGHLRPSGIFSSRQGRYPWLLLLARRRGAGYAIMSTSILHTCASTLSPQTAACCSHHQHQLPDLFLSRLVSKTRRLYPTKQKTDDESDLSGSHLAVTPPHSSTHRICRLRQTWKVGSSKKYINYDGYSFYIDEIIL